MAPTAQKHHMKPQSPTPCISHQNSEKPLEHSPSVSSNRAKDLSGARREREEESLVSLEWEGA